MTTYAYFNGTNSIVIERSGSSARVAAEEILACVPAAHRWQTNVREIMSIPLGASIDLTDTPQRTIRRER